MHNEGLSRGIVGALCKKLELYVENKIFVGQIANMKLKTDPLPGLPGPIFRATRMSSCSRVGIGPSNSQLKCHNRALKMGPAGPGSGSVSYLPTIFFILKLQCRALIFGTEHR